MAENPINLGLRFLLELAALFAFAIWGWTQHAGAPRFLWAIGLPLLAAAVWGIFRIPGDPGKAPAPTKWAPMAVSGWVRLIIEVVYFGGAIWVLFASGHITWGWVFAVLVLAHYLVSYDRVLWMLGLRPKPHPFFER